MSEVELPRLVVKIIPHNNQRMLRWAIMHSEFEWLLASGVAEIENFYDHHYWEFLYDRLDGVRKSFKHEYNKYGYLGSRSIT